MHAPRCWALFGAVLCWSAPAAAQLLSDRGPPKHRLVHRNTLAVRVNPLGLIYEGRFAYRYRLYESQSLALRDNFVGIGIAPGASPAFGKLGLYVEAQPTTVLGFWATYELVPYFGTLNLFQSFPDATAAFSDRAIRDRGALPAGDPQRGYATIGSVLTLGANLNLRFGPIVVRSQLRVFRPDFKLRAGDTTFYDQTNDLLMANRRLTLFNDLDLLFQTKFGLIAGLRHNLGLPLYGAENASADNTTHRLGPFLAYRFSDQDGARFNQPTLALVINWWLKHPYRTGAEVSQALPYIAIAFNVVGDLVPLAPVVERPAEPLPAVLPPPALAPPAAEPQPAQQAR